MDAEVQVHYLFISGIFDENVLIVWYNTFYSSNAIFLLVACIFVVERGFGGVASFGQHTQVKFLLESIRHIVSENCQDEFPNVMRYIKLLHSLCPPGRAEISYINSILKIKQSVSW